VINGSGLGSATTVLVAVFGYFPTVCQCVDVSEYRLRD
jgi:hypothetical protein